MWPTVIVASVIGGIFAWIVAVQIRNKRQGKSSCSCGGNCGVCGMNCHGQAPKADDSE